MRLVVNGYRYPPDSRRGNPLVKPEPTEQPLGGFAFLGVRRLGADSSQLERLAE